MFMFLFALSYLSLLFIPLSLEIRPHFLFLIFIHKLTHIRTHTLALSVSYLKLKMSPVKAHFEYRYEYVCV